MSADPPLPHRAPFAVELADGAQRGEPFHDDAFVSLEYRELDVLLQGGGEGSSMNCRASVRSGSVSGASVPSCHSRLLPCPEDDTTHAYNC